MKCQTCHAEIREGSKFCIKCGSPVPEIVSDVTEKNDLLATEQTVTEDVSAVSAIPDTKSDAGEANEHRESKNKKQKKKRIKNEKTPIVSVVANVLQPKQSQYIVLLLAILMINVLSYVLCSFALVTTKTMLSPIGMYLLRTICYAAAAGIIWIGSKKTTGKNRIADVMFLLGLISAERTITPLLLNRLNSLELKSNVIYACAYIVTELLIAGLMMIPLVSLFSVKDRCKQGGKILSFFFLLFSIFLPNILDFTIAVIHKESPSFMQTFAQKTAASFLMAGFMSLAVEQLLKKQNAEKKTGRFRNIIKLAAGAACLVGASSVPVVLNMANPIPSRAVDDIAGYVLQGKIYLMEGNMTDSAYAFYQAGEHCTAWNTVVAGDNYTVPEKYEDDTILNYLSALNSDTDSLANMIVHSSTSENLDIYGPIILEKLSDSGNLTEQMTELRKEIISICAGREIFINNYPSAESLLRKSEEIEKAIAPEAVDDSYSMQLRIAEIFGSAQSGEMSPDELVNVMLDLAENKTRDIACQYAAAMVGSENVWDNAGHLDRTANAALRFISLWESEGKTSSNADAAQNLLVYRQVCNMLLRVHHENDAAILLEPLVSEHPEDKETMKLLLNCYLKAKNSEKAFELSKTIHENYPDDIDVLHDCCIGALQHNDSIAAVQYADELAQLSIKDGKMDEDCDTLLFNCVSYLSFNDNESWTRFQYAIYEGDERTDSSIKTALKNNSFLNSYVQMMYYAMNERNYEKALEIADSLIKQTDSSSKLWYMKGILHFNMNEYEKAEEALLKSDRIKPNEGSTMYALANTYDALEKYEESYQLCKRVIALYPAGANHDEDWYGIVPHAQNLMNALERYVKESD